MSSTLSENANVLYQFAKGLVPDSQGNVIRKPFTHPTIPASSDPNQPNNGVLSKDVTINDAKNTWARLYLSHETLHSTTSSKLPVIVYIHGGGFVMCSPDILEFHDHCSKMALLTPCVVVSVSYRLCPEHRLPAAYEDVVEALYWMKISEDGWLKDYADMSNCFLMGGSAGGNIAYNVALRVAEQVDHLMPLSIKGLVLHQPAFGGIERTESETRLASRVDNAIPPITWDLMLELSLPIGANRDHEYSNPMAGGGAKVLEKFRLLGWKVLVIACNGDPLIDRAMELMKLLEKKGIKVVSHIDKEGYHGYVDPIIFSKTIKNFVFPAIDAIADQITSNKGGEIKVKSSNS